MHNISCDNTRSGFIALIGAPNAGKSTLINQLVGQKVSIVTHKVQTTRSIVRGVAIKGKCQIIFVDTPGIFTPRRTFDEAMVSCAWSGARDSDFLGVLIDCKNGLHKETIQLLEKLSTIKTPAILLLNKIDKIARKKLLEIAYHANKLASFQATFMICALNGDGCNDFMNYLENHLTNGPWLYPKGQMSDLPIQKLACEITREKIYLHLHQELPYSCCVETEQWKISSNGNVRINQIIYVERASHKKIIIGKSGATIKTISQKARDEITKLTGKKIHLFLFVKVNENWSKDPRYYHEIGLEFPQ